MAILTVFLIFTFGVWVRRAVLMLGSVRKYSCVPKVTGSGQTGRVSVLVPCRNEEHNLPLLVPSLLKQDYPDLELLFLDDRSTDGTLAILQEYAKQDPRIRVLSGGPLPEGWTGKNNALRQLAGAATGEWLLETDADTVHDPHSVSSAIRYATESKFDMMTLTARCVCKTFGEHLVQPMGIGCFSVWFKLDEVNDPAGKTPLACGQYLVIRRSAFMAVGGQESVKNEVTEDLALFKVMKNAGYHCGLAIGAHLFATRMYRSFRESWTGWRRIYLHALQKDAWSLVTKIGMLLAFSFFPFAVLAITGWRVWLAGDIDLAGLFWLSFALCGFILFLRSRSHAALKADQWSIVLHPLSALVIAAILVDCLHHLYANKKVVWKAQKY